ncbi:MAG: DNA-3-methyladenine glycosylase family protein [Pseudonocardiaceae bacterium]
MKTHRLELAMNRHVDFAHARETYVIYPWVRDGDELVRPLRLGPQDTQIAVARIRQAAPDRLEADVSFDAQTTEGLEQVRETLVRCLQLAYPYDAIEALATEDRVLAAALRHRGLGRGKLYPDLFEALCGVVCAQRTSFARIYGMMRKLAEAFGEPTAETVDGASVYVFPTPTQMAAASDEQLRGCGVGFRAKGLASVATYLAESGYTWQDWKSREPVKVIPNLLGIKGVGPYTANLAVNLTYGRGGTAHVDTYVTHVIGTLYLDNPNAGLEQVAQFIDHRWGELGEAVLDLLTTDTEVWVTELGATVDVRSGART